MSFGLQQRCAPGELAPPPAVAGRKCRCPDGGTNLNLKRMTDSIEYELMNFEPREVYHCAICKRFRHRTVRPGIMPAICCGQPARLFDKYKQPVRVNICEPIAPSPLAPNSGHRDEKPIKYPSGGQRPSSQPTPTKERAKNKNLLGEPGRLTQR
jgi:hypothetical protein